MIFARCRLWSRESSGRPNVMVSIVLFLIDTMTMWRPSNRQIARPNETEGSSSWFCFVMLIYPRNTFLCTNKLVSSVSRSPTFSVAVLRGADTKLGLTAPSLLWLTFRPRPSRNASGFEPKWGKPPFVPEKGTAIVCTVH